MKLPRAFFDAYRADVAVQGPRAPAPVRETARNVWLAVDDPGVPGLRSAAERLDGEHVGPVRGNPLLASARALLRALCAADEDGHERANIDRCPSDMLRSYVSIGERRIARGVSDAWARCLPYARQVLAEREAEGVE